MILISSFGSAISFPHLSHLQVCSGLYMGIKTLTLVSIGLGCSMKILSTGIRFNDLSVDNSLNAYVPVVLKCCIKTSSYSDVLLLCQDGYSCLWNYPRLMEKGSINVKFMLHGYN